MRFVFGAIFALRLPTPKQLRMPCDVVCLLEPLEPQIISGHPKVTQK